jgi:transposase
MMDINKFVGLDVAKDTIAVAVADEGREVPRYLGSIPHDLGAVRRLLSKLGEPEQLEICYEAGPTGYVLARWLRALGIRCQVIAPSLTPQRPGDHVKTDRRDALRLAQLLRAGELTEILVPAEEDERVRDLSRAREDALEDLHRARQRLIKLFLRRQIHHPSELKTRWTKSYYIWLDSLKMEDATDQLVYQEYLQTIKQCEDRIGRYETHMLKLVQSSPLDALVRILQGFRGISTLAAFTIAQEVFTFDRFGEPGKAMSYAGLVPCERSTGLSTWRGGLTKAGNAHLRRIMIEVSWSYRHKPCVKGDLKKRLEQLSPEIQRISWKAQTRLHEKYMQLVMQRRKHPNVAIAAVARELMGFLWAAAKTIQKQAQAV